MWVQGDLIIKGISLPMRPMASYSSTYRGKKDCCEMVMERQNYLLENAAQLQDALTKHCRSWRREKERTRDRLSQVELWISAHSSSIFGLLVEYGRPQCQAYHMTGF